MPAFTFEKIEPPVSPGPVSPAAKEPRSVVVRILDRLAETRIKRRLDEEGADARQKKSSE